jgi:protein-S-isoprenylcysteine O-methyltransferase Ste14
VLGGSLKNLPFVAEQLVLVALFLTRRRPRAVTTRPFDWGAAAIGGWLPLAYQIEAAAPTAERIGTTVQAVGVSAAACCILYLGRSFGVVAADRGLKTSGPYRIVRHPIYAAHLVTGLGFLVANASALNALLFSAVVAGQILRIRAEERLLLATADYAAYADRVRWRLVPFVY